MSDILCEWIELLEDRIALAERYRMAVTLDNLEAENLLSFLGTLSTKGEL